jgi:hypothetical protein
LSYSIVSTHSIIITASSNFLNMWIKSSDIAFPTIMKIMPKVFIVQQQRAIRVSVYLWIYYTQSTSDQTRQQRVLYCIWPF